MEVERFKTLLERVTNFNWEEPRNSALREEFEERRARIIYLWSASTDEAEKAKLMSEYRAPLPSQCLQNTRIS
jgi:hypothetical protein